MWLKLCHRTQEVSLSYKLEIVTTDDDWLAYHRIRCAELFTARERAEYDKHHEDEYKDNHFPLVLKFNEKIIGVVRLDLKPNQMAIMRLVAITKKEQSKGHGAVLAEKFILLAKSKGAKKIVVNSAKEAVIFYEKLGFYRQVWDEEEQNGIAKDCIQIVKELE